MKLSPIVLSLFCQHVTNAMTTSLPKQYFIGFDLGTSGARISVIEKSNASYTESHSDSVLYSSYDDPSSWNDAIHTLLQNIPQSLRSSVRSICVSGTSASCLLVDSVTGEPARGTRAKMYNYDISQAAETETETNQQVDPNISTSPKAIAQTQQWIDQYAPKNHAARANTSALSKLLHYHASLPISIHNSSSREVLAHQSEYVASTIFLSSNNEHQRKYVSDWHNALKLGYDVRSLEYPPWLMHCLESIGIPAYVLPDVVAPGEAIGTVSLDFANLYGFSHETVLVGGTTDSNAAFIAAAAAGASGGVPSYGVAVTSLGSTLAIKMLSKTFVEDSNRGVYSHRFPILNANASKDGNDKTTTDRQEELWLVGGASNVGCAVLRQENFSNEELMDLSKDMDVSTDSLLKYYPLTKMGERFPIADGMKEPVLDPKPDSRQEYLKGVLQGIALVEVMGFEILGELGASPSFPNVVMTAGGGSKNDAWLQMRERLLKKCSGGDNVTVRKADNAEASFGAAILAASRFG